MRDSHILAGLSQIERKAGHDLMALAKEIQLVRFRQEAVEDVLFAGGLKSVKAFYLAIFKPAVLRDMIDTRLIEIHRLFLVEMERMKEEATKKAKGIVLPKGVGVIGA